MSKLLAVISPAKLLDDKTHYPNLKCTQPVFLEEAEVLATKLKKLSAGQLSKLMDLSAALGQENQRRYGEWHLPFSHKNAHPAVLLFKGDVYRGLKAETLNAKDLEFATENLRILSGLYGLLRPLDLVMAYRLMMGTPFAPSSKQKNLYTFWGSKLAEELNKEIDKNGCLVNLASSEYFKAVDLKTLRAPVYHCEFKEKKGDKFVVVMTYAKQTRGKMARFLIDNQIRKVNDLKAFDIDGYAFNPKISGEDTFVFTRG